MHAMTLGQLQTFAAIARHGSLTAAARELGVSVPAVSAALATLRRELGDELVSRTPTGVALTTGGSRLAAAAAELLGIAENARRAVREAHDGSAVLRVAATHEIAEYVAGPLVEVFTRTRPSLEVSVTAAAGAAFAGLLRDRRADIALGPPVHGDPGIESVAFLRARSIVVAAPSHALAATATLDLAGLRRARWLSGPSHTDRSTALAQLVLGARVEPEDVDAFPSQAAALAAAASGRGVAPALVHTVAEELRRGALVRLDVPGTPREQLWHASTLGPGLSPPVAAMLRRFITTPEATHAILSRSGGSSARRFRPPVYITIWN